jgi:hypothetical protein
MEMHSQTEVTQMEITRKSPFTGETNTLDIDITEEQLHRWTHGNDLIQNIMPDLSADLREFIMTGITPTEWKDTFGTGESHAD